MAPVEGAVVIDIREAVLSSALQKLSALSKEPMASDNFIIFRVPAHIRQRNKHLYEPQMIAIGPYGRRDVEPSLRAMEQLKWRYLQEFLSHSPNTTIEELIAEIQEVEPRARRCYFERVELSTEKFVEMLLLDGCFIVEFLIKWNRQDKGGACTAGWSLPLIRDDLLLLENQIPLFVLEKLFNLRNFKTDCVAATPMQRPAWMELLVNYLITTLKFDITAEETESSNEEVVLEGNNDDPAEAEDFHHLLHIYYRCNVTTPQTEPTCSTICATILKWLWPSSIFTSLLSKIRRSSHKKRLPRTIPSATELLDAGVAIRKKNKKNWNRRLSSFIDITFCDGVLEIPFLSMDNSTLSRVVNLVAFEQCSRCKPEEAYVTSYAMFMDCLIDTPRDVAILHQRGVLENQLATDNELAVFFNQLSDCAVLDYENHHLARLFRVVGEYCDSDWHKWRAKVIRDYFTYPWPILSLSAAAVVLISTLVQAFFAFHSYYHPRN